MKWSNRRDRIIFLCVCITAAFLILELIIIAQSITLFAQAH